jgi:hypothetical protein
MFGCSQRMRGLLAPDAMKPGLLELARLLLW